MSTKELKIFKYEIPIDDTFTLDLPENGNFKILDVQVQNGTPVVWILIDESVRKSIVHFYLIGTGNPIDDNIHEYLRNYIGTFQLNEFVGHLFYRFV